MKREVISSRGELPRVSGLRARTDSDGTVRYYDSNNNTMYILQNRSNRVVHGVSEGRLLPRVSPGRGISLSTEAGDHVVGTRTSVPTAVSVTRANGADIGVIAAVPHRDSARHVNALLAAVERLQQQAGSDSNSVRAKALLDLANDLREKARTYAPTAYGVGSGSRVETHLETHDGGGDHLAGARVAATGGLVNARGTVVRSDARFALGAGAPTASRNQATIDEMAHHLRVSDRSFDTHSVVGPTSVVGRLVNWLTRGALEKHSTDTPMQKAPDHVYRAQAAERIRQTQDQALRYVDAGVGYSSAVADEAVARAQRSAQDWTDYVDRTATMNVASDTRHVDGHTYSNQALETMERYGDAGMRAQAAAFRDEHGV